MVVDEKGYAFIKANEGFRSTPYQCEAGHWTIGYGHTEDVDDKTPSCSQSQAEALLRNDLAPIEFFLDNFVLVPLTQNEFNALADFVFNLGRFKVQYSTLFRRLNAGDKQGAGREFLKWAFYMDPKTEKMVRSQGLLARREKEKTLFLFDLTARKNAVNGIV